MKELMKTNIYDVNKTIIVVGSCLKTREPQVFEQLQKITSDIYDVCLEETHINMAISKIGGMLRTGKIKKIIFATVDNCAGYKVHSVFDPKDLSDYASYPSHECPMCKSGERIDALVNSHGYSKI